jgi:hypothetical protein
MKSRFAEFDAAMAQDIVGMWWHGNRNSANRNLAGTSALFTRIEWQEESGFVGME